MTDRISNYPFTPLNDGDWTKDRGNSVWYPTPDVKPKKFNNSEDPVNAKTWSEITKDANDVRNERISENKKVYPIPKEVQDENGNWNGGIPFNEGKPDFSFLSRGTVEISPFTEKRYQNFKRARIAYCEQRTPPVSQTKVRNWMKKNGYTWHEVDETGRMEKVPSIIHGNVCHSGGISSVKQSATKKANKNRTI